MPEHNPNQPLLPTKLNQPQVSRELIRRPRLLDQLRSPARLVLVVAPAGYGKTTLLRTWLDDCPLPSAWLSLDERDNDLFIFTSYLVAAVRTHFPSFGEDTLRLLNSLYTPSLAILSRSLLGELAALDEEFVMVLDDYHLIHNSAIHQLLTELLRHPPPVLHLVLASRINPALPLPGLRARGIVQELRVADLRFTLDEIGQFIRGVMHLEISDEELVSLNGRTEGWPASLRLAAIHFRQSGSSSLMAANQRGGNRQLLNYLADEVTRYIPDETQSFLMRTSILDLLTESLCDAVMGFGPESNQSRKQLEWLQDIDLFTLPLKDAPGWYRYHHTFRQYLLIELRNTLSSDEIAGLQMRASRWYDGQGMVEEAIRHALAAEDIQAAAGIFARHRCDVMDREEWRLLEGWLRLFPREVIESQPELLLCEVWFMFTRQQLAAIPAKLDQAETLIAESTLEPADRQRLLGELATRRAMLSYFADDTARTLRFARKALEDLPTRWWHTRSLARLFMSAGYLDQGRLARALDNLYNSGEPDHGRAFQARMLGLACFVHWESGDLSGMEKAAAQILAWTDIPGRAVESKTWAHYYLGILHYARNDFAKAEVHLLQLVLNPYQAQVECFLYGAAALVLLYQASGQSDRASELVDIISTYALEGNNPGGLSVASALKAELALRQGRLSEAAQWTKQYELPRAIRFPYFYAEPITLVKILLAQDTPASRKRAGLVLSRLNEKFTAEHQTHWLISVLALQALLHQAQGHSPAALKVLQRAVNLAEPGGFIRLFVDLGSPIKTLLAALARKKVSPVYLTRVLAAFDEEESRQALVQRTSPQPDMTPNSLVNLTAREREVLEFLEMRYTDKEISEALVISRETVHSHISHMSDKLGVNGRRAIVQAAKEQGLLD